MAKTPSKKMSYEKNQDSGMPLILIIIGIFTLLGSQWLSLVLSDILKLDYVSMFFSSILLSIGLIELVSGIMLRKKADKTQTRIGNYILLFGLSITSLMLLPAFILVAIAIAGPPF